MTIDTLPSRKFAETERRVRAAARVVDDLRDFARDRGGRFIVFGSFVAGRMRFDSDLDILIDFGPAESDEAWRFVEDLGVKTGLDIDLHDARVSKTEFVKRAVEDGLILG